MRLAPFRALRYDPDVAGPGLETSAPPYDELDRLRYAAHRTANPYTVLELIAGEGLAAFEQARATLDRWQRTGVLVEDTAPAMYLYEEHELRHGVPTVQRGIVAALDLQDLADGTLLLHEHVEAERAVLRAQRMQEVPIDLTPVVALHVGGTSADVAAVIDRARARPPLVAFTDEASIDHRLWRIDDPADLALIVEGHRDVTAVLADGHHRIAAAQHIVAARLAGGLPAGRWGRATAWLVDAEQHGPELRAVHRMVHGDVPRDGEGAPQVPGFHPLPWHRDPRSLADALAHMPGLTFGLVTARDIWVLRAGDEQGVRRAAAPDAPELQLLDAQVLSEVVAPAIDPRRRTQPVFDLDETLSHLQAGAPGALVLLSPPTAAQVLQIAAAGTRMPAKTTWFRPKPRAGLIMRRLDGDPAADVME